MQIKARNENKSEETNSKRMFFQSERKVTSIVQVYFSTRVVPMRKISR